MMNYTFLDEWMMFDDHRVFFESSSRNEHDQADKAKSHPKIIEHEWNMRQPCFGSFIGAGNTIWKKSSQWPNNNRTHIESW